MPDGDGPAPVAVVIHGGFWRAGYGRKLMRPLCEDLAERGWIAWNVEYRRLGHGSGGGWPTTFEDVAAAIDHVRDWVAGTNGKWVTMGIPSDGSYGIPEDIMYGFPVTTAGGEYTMVKGLEIDEFSRGRMDTTLKELLEERDGVKHLLP